MNEGEKNQKNKIKPCKPIQGKKGAYFGTMLEYIYRQLSLA